MIHFKLQELVHILTLCAAHDSRVCPVCDAIVMQLTMDMKRRFEHPVGEGGYPPSTKQDEVEDLPF